MYINALDTILDTTINKFFNDFLSKYKFKINLKQDTSIGNYKEEITLFIDKLNLTKDISLDKSKEKKVKNIFLNYCFFYLILFVGITNFKNNNKKFISFLIMNYKNSLSENLSTEINAELINNFYILCHIEKLIKLDKNEIKILYQQNSTYKSTIDFLNNVPKSILEIIKKNSEIDKNILHILIKLILYINMFIKNERLTIIKIIDEQNIKDAEYEYINIIVPTTNHDINIEHIEILMSEYQKKNDLHVQFYLIHQNSTQLVITDPYEVSRPS